MSVEKEYKVDMPELSCFEGFKAPQAIGSCTIKNGSRLIIGGERSRIEWVVHQHFNWFQKLMWKWCFGVRVEDYSKE